MTFNKDKICQYFEKFYKEILKIQFKTSHKQNILFLIDKIENDSTITDIYTSSYILSTVLHESAFTLAPIEEYEAKPGTRVHNLQKKYFPDWKGRGFVQITHKSNYEKLSKYVNYDLVKNPKLALNKDVAYSILSIGMVKGLFTGKKLSNYINNTKTDYVGARAVVNGTDRAEKIAYYAKCIENILKISIVEESNFNDVPPYNKSETSITDSEVDVNRTLVINKAEPIFTGGIQSARVALTGILSSVGVSLAGIWSWLQGKLTSVSENLIFLVVVLCMFVAATLIITHLIIKYKEKNRRETQAHELNLKQLELHADPEKHNVRIV